MINNADAIINTHNSLINTNQHGLAVGYLALKCGMERDYQCMKHINALHEIEGGLTPLLKQMRDVIYERVHTEARKQLNYKYGELR